MAKERKSTKEKKKPKKDIVPVEDPNKNIPAPKKNKKKGKSMSDYVLNAGCRGGRGGCSEADGVPEWVDLDNNFSYFPAYFI